MTVISLEERQQHVTIETESGVHVLPVSLIRDVVAGRNGSDALGEAVIQRIIQEWLGLIGDRN